MINQIIQSISIALDAEFCEKEYGFYMEAVKQDLKNPCFFITCINPVTTLFLGKRYFRKNQFVIQYFPEAEEDSQRECNETAERMVWCLENISAPTGEKFRGTKMNYQVMEGVLHFFVNYDCFVYRVEHMEAMGKLESNITVGKGV